MTHGSLTLRDQRVLASVMALREASPEDVRARMLGMYSRAVSLNEIARALLTLAGRGVLRSRAVDGITRFSVA